MPSMKVIVSRSGGFAGLRHTWTVVVDQQPDESRWKGLIDELPWSDAPRPAAGVDRFQYEIRVNTHRVVIPEGQLTGPWRELVERVRAVNDPMTPDSGAPDRATPEQG